MSQPEPYGPEDWSSAAWRVALVDELPDYQMRYFDARLEWLAARNRVNERLYEAKVAELEQLQQRQPAERASPTAPELLGDAGGEVPPARVTA